MLAGGMMLERAKRTWRELKGSPAGHRFEMHHRRERERRGGSSPPRRAISLVAAIAALVIGIVLVFIPGPAILFFAVAAALLATQSLAVARALDWMELEGRAAWRALRRWYGRRSSAGKMSLLIGIGCAIGGLAA